jgi:hypothetical protein
MRQLWLASRSSEGGRVFSPALRCPEECEEIRVHLVLVRGAHAVRRSVVDLELSVLDQLSGARGRGPDRHDLVVVTVQDQRGHVEPLQVLRLIRLGDTLIQSYAALCPACIPWSQNESRKP